MWLRPHIWRISMTTVRRRTAEELLREGPDLFASHDAEPEDQRDSPGMRARTADEKHQLAQSSERTVYIENGGALFRGPGRAWPREIWSPTTNAWEPHGWEVPKRIEWGSEISEAEALDHQGRSRR